MVKIEFNVGPQEPDSQTRLPSSLASLKIFKVDHSMADWTPAAMSKLDSLKNLIRLSLSFSSFNSDSKSANSYTGAEMLEELKNLDQLEVLRCWCLETICWNYSDDP